MTADVPFAVYILVVSEFPSVSITELNSALIDKIAVNHTTLDIKDIISWDGASPNINIQADIWPPVYAGLWLRAGSNCFSTPFLVFRTSAFDFGAFYLRQ
jgi:hypothetical protein